MAPPDTPASEQNLHEIEDSNSAGSNAFVSDEASRVEQTRPNVVRFQPGVALQHGLRRVAGGQHAKDMLDGEPTFLMIGLPPKMAGFDVIRRRSSVSLQVLATTHLLSMLPQFRYLPGGWPFPPVLPGQSAHNDYRNLPLT